MTNKSTSRTYDVFVSHATEDDSTTSDIGNVLIAAGITPWIDHKGGIDYGDKWRKAIRDGTNVCKCGLFIASHESVKSANCLAEVNRILDRDKKLYIAKIETVPLEEFPPMIGEIQWADLTCDFDGELKRLIARLKLDLEERITEPPDVQLLRGIWKYLNYKRIESLCNDVINGHLRDEDVVELGDAYLPWRNNPEHQFYDNEIETALKAFDSSLTTLFEFTGTYFYVGDNGQLRLKYRLDPMIEMYHVYGGQDFEVYQFHQRGYAKMIQAAKTVFQKHEKLINLLRKRKLLPIAEVENG